MYQLTTGEKQRSTTTPHGLSVKGKNPHAHARTRLHTRTHTHTPAHAHTKTEQKRNTKTQYFSIVHSIYNKHKFRIILQCFLSEYKRCPSWVYIYIFSVVYCWLIFKYISVTTCNCLLYLTASPFSYLRVSGFRPPAERARRSLRSVRLNATVLNTGQKMSDCHFNTWK